MMDGIAFENYIGQLLIARFQDEVIVVSADYMGDLGCDFLLQKDRCIIQAYSPQDHGYVGSDFISRVKTKINNDLKKAQRNSESIEEMLGGPIKQWKLLIPEDPTPELLSYCSTKQKDYEFEIQIQGKSHLESLKREVGYDPIDESWMQLKNETAALGDESVYGECRLDDLYVEPNATATFPGENEQSDIQNGLIIDLMEKHIKGENLIKGIDFTTKPFIVFGEYGSGKTSSLKKMASLLAKGNSYYFPVFIPLREAILKNTQSLLDGIGEYLLLKKGIHNFINDLGKRPIVWLLDGFDELNLFESRDENWIVERYNEIDRLAQAKNSRVILTSRPILFLGKPANIPLHTVRVEISLFDDNQISSWIKNWKSLPNHSRSTISIEGLRARNLLEETANPLILFMVATLFEKELVKEKVYLRSEIFKIFIDSTEKGKFFKEERFDQVHTDLPDNYRDILREIAFMAFRFGTGGLIAKQDLLDKLPKLVSDLDNLGNSRLRTLLVGHFFREAEIADTNKYIEFSHQSFREYLVVEKIIQMFSSLKDKKFSILEWHYLCTKMLTQAKLHFLRESLCLLEGELRKNIFDKLVSIPRDPGGLEKLVNKDNLDSNSVTVLRASDFTAIIRKILAYYVCSVISAYSSEAFRQNLALSGSKDSLGVIYHACCKYKGDSTIWKAWQLFLEELPGGIFGPKYNWNNLVLNVKDFSDFAIVTPRTNIIELSCRNMSVVFISLMDYQSMCLATNKSSYSVFKGGTFLLNNLKTEFDNCVFINCRLIAARSDCKLTFDNCAFYNSECIGIDAEDMQLNDQNDSRGQSLMTLIEKAETILSDYSTAVDVGFMVPWGDVITQKIPDFEQSIFPDINKGNLLQFNNACRVIAQSLE